MLQKKNKKSFPLLKRIVSRSQDSRSGFTLIEMILVVAITLFLLVATVQGFANSSAQFGFGNASVRVEELVRQARSLAISGKAQLDYANYAHKDAHCDGVPSASDPCLATPAHYGVNFATVGTGYVVTLFVDNHTPSPCPVGACGVEGKFDAGSAATDYANGFDIILDTYALPSGMKFIIPNTDGTTNPGCTTSPCSATIFYSPVFADVTSDLTDLPPTTPLPTDPFFRFGISQTSGTLSRKHCSEIHILAGVSEPMSGLDLTHLDSCP